MTAGGGEMRCRAESMPSLQPLDPVVPKGGSIPTPRTIRANDSFSSYHCKTKGINQQHRVSHWTFYQNNEFAKVPIKTFGKKLLPKTAIAQKYPPHHTRFKYNYLVTLGTSSLISFSDLLSCFPQAVFSYPISISLNTYFHKTLM